MIIEIFKDEFGFPKEYILKVNEEIWFKTNNVELLSKQLQAILVARFGEYQ